MRPRAPSSPPKAELPPFLQPHPEGVLLHLKIQPRASQNGLEGVLGEELKIKVTAPPVDGAANEAVVELLAECLDCPQSALAIVHGQTARHKVVLVRGLSAHAAWERIRPLL